MIALFRFSYSPFDNRDISLDGLAAYASDQNQRMSANNPNGVDLSSRIAATATALGVFHDALDSDQSRLGIRKGAKLVKVSFRRDLSREAEKVVAAVIAVFGGGSPEVLGVVPQGRTIFNRARDERIQDHLQTMVDGVAALESTLGAALTAKAVGLRDAWDAIYAASVESTGGKIATEQARQAARDALSWELYRNVRVIADLFPRDPDKMRLYSNQGLLGLPERTGSGDDSGGSESSAAASSSSGGSGNESGGEA